MKCTRFHCITTILLLSLIGNALRHRAVAAGQPQDVTKRAPVAAASSLTDWATLKAAYDYDAHTPVTMTTEERPDTSLHIEHLIFTGTKGQTVTGLFVRPKAEGVYPVALVLHGVGSNKESAIDLLGKALVARGVACLALDAPLHGERRPKNAMTETPRGIAFLTVVHDGILDYRQVIGYLTTQRKDVDRKRLGLIGNSMGAMMGAILTAVDDRITAAALCVGGDPIHSLLPNMPEAIQPLAASASCDNYIGHISPRPVFMINARQDKTITVSEGKLFQESARKPKTIVWVISGHMLPTAERQKAIDWLAKQMTTRKSPLLSHP